MIIYDDDDDSCIRGLDADRDGLLSVNSAVFRLVSWKFKVVWRYYLH